MTNKLGKYTFLHQKPVMPSSPIAADETGSRSLPFFGDKLYQRRARAALPLLVGLAAGRRTIYYQQLAELLNMSNARNLNYVLGSVGQTLLHLGQEWSEKIPPIECLAINKSDELPGEGVGYFIVGKDYKKMLKTERRLVVDEVHESIWSYSKWDAVLSALSLNPLSSAVIRKVRRSSISQGGGFGTAKENKLVEEAAVRCATKYLVKRGYGVVSRERDGIGYDLDATRGRETLHVEVKGVSGRLLQFLITRGEVMCGRNDPDFRLFVVTNARAAKPKLHRYSGGEVEKKFRLDAMAFRATPK